MNRTKIYLAAGAAVLLALVAGVGSYKFLSEKSELAARSRLQTVVVAVAAVDIPIGATINPNQVAASALELFLPLTHPLAELLAGGPPPASPVTVEIIGQHRALVVCRSGKGGLINHLFERLALHT